VISKLINIDQSAYIKGRYIRNYARLIQDVFDFCEDHNEDGILLFIDFEKAFGTVECSFMIETLKPLHLGKNFINRITTLYNKPLFRVEKEWLCI
jgi:hypothetical protein